MKSLLLLAAGALALSPSAALAQQSNGSTNGAGWTHMNGPDTTGQPGADCEDLIATGDGSFPGQSGDNGNSAFGGTAGDFYAGSQPQNSRNTASVSQYDVACENQPPQAGGNHR